MLKTWSEIIPQREGYAFTSKSRLCRLHFTEDSFHHEQGTSKCRLKCDAVPSKFPQEIPDYLIKKAYKRKPPTDRENVPIKKRPRRSSVKAPVAVEEERREEETGVSTVRGPNNIYATAEAREEIMEPEAPPVVALDAGGNSDEDEIDAAVAFDFDQFIVDAPAMMLPPGWEVKIHMDEVVCFSKMAFQQEIGFFAEKTVLFQRGTPTTVIIKGRPIRPINDFGTNLLITSDNLIQFITDMDDKYKLCQGIINNTFAEDCSGLMLATSKNVRCHECKVKFAYLSVLECRKRMRKRMKKKPPAYTSLRQKMAALRTSVTL
jgi:hypothetical protein